VVTAPPCCGQELGEKWEAAPQEAGGSDERDRRKDRAADAGDGGRRQPDQKRSRDDSKRRRRGRTKRSLARALAVTRAAAFHSARQQEHFFGRKVQSRTEPACGGPIGDGIS
jgi:hypothetical protein